MEIRLSEDKELVKEIIERLKEQKKQNVCVAFGEQESGECHYGLL